MTRLSFALCGLVALLWTASAAGQGYGPGPGARQDIGPLTAPEAATLAYQREEERFARDSYRTLYGVWSEPVFANIAEAESRHMQALANMLIHYGVDDPIVDQATGAFTNGSGLGALYDDLMADGGESLLAAYRVGGYVEEMSIRDLRGAIAGTQQEPLLTVYRNLLAGSQNHLRVWAGHIENLGYEYEAQLLSQTDVDAILSGLVVPPPERGFRINANLSDAWYDPATEGQGFFISVFPDQRKILVAWFTYDTVSVSHHGTAELGHPGQRWLIAQGSYIGAQAELPVYSMAGGEFDTYPPAPTADLVGSIFLQFENCGSGSVTYDLPGIDRQGVIPIVRVALDNVTHCQRNNQP